MNNLKEKALEIYEDNKKVINLFFILLAIVLILTLAVNLFAKDKEINSKDNLNVSVLKDEIEEIGLFGSLKVTINEGEKYIEPGYYAYTKSGKLKTEEVVVTNEVNTNKPGIYTITYLLGNKKITRTVEVLEKKVVGTLSFSLKGSNLITLNQGDEYKEPGYEAFDTVDGDISSLVKVSGKVDTSQPGTYSLTYTVKTTSNLQKSLTRTIIVSEGPVEVSITSSNMNYTNQDITLKIHIIGNNFTYIKYPDNTVSKKKDSTYKINANGNYKFYIYDSDGKYFLKEFKVTNIDKTIPNGTCTLKNENGKSVFYVSANDTGSGIKNYRYYGNNQLLTTTTMNSYVASFKLTSAYVYIYDNASNSKRINCQIENESNLEVHFIDVGREDAILIRSHEKVILIDGGSYSKRNIVTPYLKDLGITHIDAMIGSHLHYNHIQAQADILENFTVDKIYYPQDLNTCYSTYCDTVDQKYILNAIKKYNKKISIMKVNDNFNIGDINIFCIGPISFQTKSQNKYRQNYNSLNFILTYGNNKFMFTGDYMQYSNILKKFSKSILNVDVLKYPHHGNASLGKELVNAMSPRYVVLTSSKDELSSRNEKSYLSKLGANFYYSYKHRNILMISDGNKITVKTNVIANNYKR